MDLIIEFIEEFILEGSIELINNKNVPILFRVLLGVIVTIVIFVIVGILIFGGIQKLDNDLIFGIILMGLGVIILGLFGCLVLKIIPEIKKNLKIKRIVRK